jgi:hypothetical protein
MPLLERHTSRPALLSLAGSSRVALGTSPLPACPKASRLSAGLWITSAERIAVQDRMEQLRNID